MTCISELMPEGWRFYSADASIFGRVSVMLIRNEQQKRLWLKLAEDEMGRICLHVSGQGDNLTGAMADAVRKALGAPLLEERK